MQGRSLWGYYFQILTFLGYMQVLIAALGLCWGMLSMPSHHHHPTIERARGSKFCTRQPFLFQDLNTPLWDATQFGWSRVIDSTMANAQPTPALEATQYGLFSRFDPVIETITIGLICTFFFIWIFWVLIRRCTDPSTATASHALYSSRSGLESDVIETFPIYMYSAAKGIKVGEETVECAVCLGEFHEEEMLRLLPKCDHVFHLQCIDAWLTSHVTCPVCRANLSPDTPKKTKASSAPADPMMMTNSNQNISSINEEAAITVMEEELASSSTRALIKLPRSHSTGHSVIN